jgi:hypothetical protein
LESVVNTALATTARHRMGRSGLGAMLCRGAMRGLVSTAAASTMPVHNAHANVVASAAHLCL